MATEKRQTVLWVDDNCEILMAVKTLFRKEEYEIITALNKKDALKYYGREFDVIVLDGLERECFELAKDLSAKRKIIFTGSKEVYRKAESQGFEAQMKPKYIPEVLK